MRLEPPSWWYGRKRSWASVALLPVAGAYGLAVETRFRLTEPYVSRLPVICVGNFTMGGAGKTPTAIAIAGILRELGRSPGFLTRGYGGAEAGPRLVDVEEATVEKAGDEALLLAGHGPTVVSRKRPLGAQLLETLGCDCIVMDDGFQNPSLRKDFSVVVIDGGVGLGNGRIFPAGPLRGALTRQLERASVVLVVGGSAQQRTALAVRIAGLPALKATLAPSNHGIGLAGRRVVAFCGIGRPAKFFQTLREMGADVVETVSFPDHHDFTEKDAARLLALAKKSGAGLVTTEKDILRLKGKSGVLGTLRERTVPLPVKLVFDGDDGGRLAELLLTAVRSARLQAQYSG